VKVAIIKYNAGNIHSVRLALQRLEIDPIVTDDPTLISGADKVIFPGVGEASSAMEYLKQRKLDHLLLDLKQPVLGICLGLQLMCRWSEENNTECLDIFKLNVRKFPPEKKVPHMGWNTITHLNSKLFKNVPENSYVYFVHSYFAEYLPDAISQTEYICQFSSSLQSKNYYAVQFHPEKSGKIGEKILKNFLEL
jgi:imidazole glycerol-phosphate synthase subunit HisH